MAEFRKWIYEHITTEVVEGRGGHTPLASLSHALLFPLLLSFKISVFSTLGVSHFMESAENVASGDVFETGASLDEQATGLKVQIDFLPFSGPE